MKKRILITGGTGFIGANLVHRLVKEGYRPTVFVRKSSNLSRLQNIISKIQCIETDLQNRKLLSQQIRQIKPTHIFHLAVYGAHQAMQKNVFQTYTQNIISSVNLIEICCKQGFQQFINIGSSSEYGLKKAAMKEIDLLHPINHYGVAKMSISLAAAVFNDKYKLPISTLRLFNPYGYFEDKKRFIPYLIQNSIRGKIAKLSSPLYVRDFIFIDDVINALLLFISDKNSYSDIFNIGSGKQYSLQDVINILNVISNNVLKVKWNNHISNQPEPSVWKADISKAKKLLKWKPEITLKQGLQKTYQWIFSNRQYYET